MKNNKNNKRLLILAMFTIIILCIALAKKVFENDTFYTIKIGNLILDNGIDMLDHFSIHNILYIYPHWLYDVFIGIIYNLFGLTGIYISNIVLFIILMLLIYFINIKFNKNYLVSYIFILLCMFGLSFFVTARAQLVTYILFVIEFYALEKIYQDKKNLKIYSIVLILISLLICNIHCATWSFYFILYLPFIGEYICSLLFKSNNKLEINKNKNIKYLVIIMLLSVLCGFITPIGNTAFTYVFKLNQSNALNYVLEHHSLSLFKSPVALVMIIETLLIVLFTNTKIKLRDLFMILGLIFMSIISGRHVAFLLIIGTISMCRILSTFFNNNEEVNNNITNIICSKVFIIVLSICLCGVSSLIIYNNSKVNFIDEYEYPVDASNYILNNLDVKNIRLYNDYNYGSYLLLKDIPVFIDSRADLYTKAFSGLDYDILDDSRDIHTCKSNYLELLNKYEFTHIITYSNAMLAQNLHTNADYKLIYSDKYFVIFEVK